MARTNVDDAAAKTVQQDFNDVSHFDASSSSLPLLTSMAQRLRHVEAAFQKQQRELAAKDMEIAQLRAIIEVECP